MTEQPKKPRVDLQEVALYARRAQLENLPVGPTVAEVMNLSLARARYYLARARSQGFLVDLDHAPTQAVILRNSAHERVFIVCQTCLVPWPCQVAAHHYDTR